MFQKALCKRGFSGPAKGLDKMVQLRPLPYELGALEPILSGHLLDFHYGNHHRVHIKRLNDLTEKAKEFSAKGNIAAVMEI